MKYTEDKVNIVAHQPYNKGDFVDLCHTILFESNILWRLVKYQGNVLIVGPDVYKMFNARQSHLPIPIFKPGSQQIVILDENYVGMFNGVVKVYLDENLGDSCIIAYIDKRINSGIKIEAL